MAKRALAPNARPKRELLAVIDYTKCENAALCADLLSRKIKRGVWAPSVSKEPLEADEIEPARWAENSCPALAFHIVEK